MIPFDQDDLKELANSSSFNKGKDYYKSGCVKKIIKNGNIFEGKVEGSSLYKVSLDISDDELEFNCSCPYSNSFDGICKHSVAFGLAVLDGKFDEKSNNLPTDAPNKLKEFKDCIENADTQTKLNFLKQLLEKDNDLKSSFVEFSQSKSKNLDSITAINIDEISETISDELASTDFDAVMEDYDCYRYGYYDDEGYYDEARDEIMNVLEPYINQSITFCKKGNLLDAIRILLGIYEGIQNLPENDNFEYEIFPDGLTSGVFDIFNREYPKIVDAVEKAIKTDEIIFQVFDLIIQRFNLFKDNIAENGNNATSKEKEDDYGDNYDEEDDYDDDDDYDEDDEKYEIVYDLKFFDKLLMSLIINKNTANYLHTLLHKNSLECHSTVYVLLKIAEITNNEKLFLETAEKYVELEKNIAQQLLDFYKTQNDNNNFIRISNLSLNKWPDTFSLYLINNLDKKTEEELYVKALKHYTVQSKSTKHFKELKNYLSEEERFKFVDDVGKSYYQAFYIELLEIEKRYEDLLKLAEKKSYMDNNFCDVITPIANIYPDKCFELIKTRCDAAIKSHDRNRDTYRRMAEWLSVMSMINSKKHEAKEYIKSLYNHKPNLPALKDELRKELGEDYIK